MNKILACSAFSAVVVWVVVQTMGDLILRDPAQWWWLVLPVVH